MEPYSERCRWPLSCRLAYGALVLGMPLIIGLSGEPQALPIALGAFLVLGGIGYRLAWVDLRIDEEAVSYGFRGLRNRVPWSRVVSLETEKYRFGRYLGWGYRVGGRRDRGYAILGVPAGLRLRFRDEKDREWSVFLSSRAPEAAVNAANRKVS